MPLSRGLAYAGMYTVGRNLLLVTMAALMLSGCGSKQQEGDSTSSGSTPGTRKSGDPARAAMMRNTVAAVAANKSVEVPVQVRFQLHQRPDVGQPVDIDLVIIPSSEALDQISGQVQADDGLELVGGIQIPPTQHPADGVPITHSIKVLPRRDGIFTFSVVLSVDYAGQTLTQTYSMPVIAGSGITNLPAAGAKSAKPARPPTGSATAAAH
jgi:hypothetical protein